MAEAQQANKIARIGFISIDAGPNFDLFKHSLRDLGYVEGTNIAIEPRFVEGRLDRIPALVAELVQSQVDVIVAAPISAIQAAKHATKTIPIVMLTLHDPVEWKLVDSFARPGGNITGIARLTRELSGKRLQLLRETVPHASRIGILGDVKLPGSSIAVREYENAARQLNLQLQMLDASGPKPDLDVVFIKAVKAHIKAVVTIGNPILNHYTREIANLTVKNRMAAMFESGDYVQAGGLMSYSTVDADVYRRAATYVDKILKGANPSDLPVEQPTKFELFINLKAAKQIGLTIPPNVLARADRVIK